MAIRDRVRRALHKSDASSDYSQSGSNITTTTTATTSASETSSTSTSSSLRHHTSRFFSSWRSNDRDRTSDHDKEKKKKRTKPIHPRDRPLTTTNIRHQEMLSHFTMTFGSSASRLSQVIDDFEFDGVSPCCTRAPSINGDSIAPDDTTTGTRTSSIDEPRVI
ncbi:hypothetical protein V2G26_013954 [Clonostachys chloroleuca]|uniref:Uncharacterized protein n=1 Tax=Clonostachys chloroleuca TaxID=1926264 RepID=A0AA35PXA8_9HYPO|nr:unnamed protein product [Clonostachys chloroleuca]